MQVTTLITLPEDVYKFYKDTAQQLKNRSMEQLMADILSDYARQSSGEHPNHRV